ncbi:hypothetical protein COS81_01100 [candidate division WWE3 bacterium CG06_land_8_20_14_3_00_42_16]|uniref:DNA-directed DNA polymerase n=3 Tax=Katanobacteria TaxID=422282 RepID=A0A2M7AP56_UNCKA|nr:MAG: hypothetical protein AUJ38_02965 [bacterium CG1_02_42_9]PIU69179.1 MAG: hypothetical protein COS81_01100 [candidate division WWE3 bacterium CG06_land_8_20_14_3_00_42_16]PJA38171.1 MAG: hypothetical protein CO181_01010 [candidate division WWE3 bacterium CG_4_9_14_3_um_filter_43_9]PJC68762.1 MAG: hypothetical protein CO015_02840 [candidate division WWE3 bacterium CG_4_8_14_3_um_filter_42_11]
MDNSLLFKGPEKINKLIRPVLDSMTKIGIAVDLDILDKLSGELRGKIEILEKKAFEALGHMFNLNSPKQLAEVLFVELKLPPAKRTKTGYSTDEQTLKNLLNLHPLIAILLDYRELYKVQSTYAEALPRAIGSDNRIHSIFQADKTATGRLTSSEPNLQNIPIRGEWGERIRRAFVPSSGFIFLTADYSQFEFRILAHFTGDGKLLSSFENHIDIHRATAAEIFHKKPAEITDEERRVAKTVNFGILYGMSPHGLSEELGIDHEQAQNFIHDYFTSFGTVKFYLENLLRQACKKGYIETLGGFRRYIPELGSDNLMVRSSGERMAINFPTQGTAAEIMKVAMINLFGRLRQEKLKSRIILQIHDELLLEVSTGEMEKVKPIVKEEMEGVIKLKVPLKVDLKLGQNWGEMKEIAE